MIELLINKGTDTLCKQDITLGAHDLDGHRARIFGLTDYLQGLRVDPSGWTHGEEVRVIFHPLGFGRRR